MAFSLGSLLATAGSARAGARRGQREERQYQDDLALQREQADRANRMAMFNEWAQRENIRLRERDQDMDSQDRRTAADQRAEQAAAQRKAQAEALIAARMEKGWTDSTPGEQRMDAARAVMRINPMTGMTRGADVDQRTYVEEGAKPFAKEIEGVKFEAGRAAGGPQRTLIGGRALRYDPQDVLNRTKDKEATDFEKDARLARIRGEEQRITIQVPRPDNGQQRPTEGESKDYLFSQMLDRGFADMEEVANKIDAKKVSAYFTSKVFKPTLTPEEQVYVRGAREATAALLRKESGAQIKDNEVADALARYIDTGFDSPDMAAKKKIARDGLRETYRRMGSRAGRFYDEQDGKSGYRPENPYKDE